MEGQETDIKTGLEDAVNPDVQGGSNPASEVDEGKTPSSSGSSVGNADQNGKGSWLSQVPKDIRESIPDKYDNVWDYVRDLKSSGKNAGPETTDEAFAEEWKKYLSEDDGKDPVLTALNTALQEAGISAPAARKLGDTLKEASQKNLEGMRNNINADREKRAREYIQKNWGATKEERQGNLALYQRCAKLMEKEKPEEFRFLVNNSLLSEPAIVSLITGLYSSRQEVVPPGGVPGIPGGVPGDRYGIV